LRRPFPRPLLPFLFFVVSLALAAAAPEESRRVRVSDELTAVVVHGEIVVEASPFEGESPAEFSRRVTRDESIATAILERPAAAHGTPVVVPFGALSPEAQLAAVRALFPDDVRSSAGWIHRAAEDENAQAVVAWFTGRPEAVAALSKANGLSGPVLRKGTAFRIPTEFLTVPFRDAEAIPESEPVSLEFGEDARGRFALYRIRKGEALYSAVVVRFTGRLFAEDVIQLALEIADRSGIEDVHGIPVGYPVKIPIAALSAEFLPKEDPRARALAQEKAEASQFGAPIAASGLAGVRVVLDAGHGGRDTGTIHRGVWESTYVYDVACRLRKVLTERTKADVVMTTRGPSGWDTPERDRLKDSKSRTLLTDPPHLLSDPVTGVNLRWYLANSVLRRPGPDKKPVPAEKTVFISLHADSLHPSVRGAMAYVPGERFLRDRYGKRGAEYAVYREWKEEPVVSFLKKDRVAAEGVSTRLAQRILAAIGANDLAVHPFSPVRTHVIRGGREWVPAVLRYNRIPGRVLIEISNLANDTDRELTLKREFRQKMAESIASGLLDFFGAGAGKLPAVRTATLTAVSAPVPVVRATAPIPSSTPDVKPSAAPPVEREPIGPIPEPIGPWPERAGPRPDAIGPRAPASAFRTPAPGKARTDL
jgi:N-acetylmuramoyl-L-alanine amidase